MTAAELIAAFHGAVNLNSQVFFGYVSLMSGFLVVSYLVGHRLPTFLASIVVALFTVVSALLVFRLLLNGGDAQALLSYMLEQEQLGQLDLAGFGSHPRWVTRVVLPLEILSTIGGFIGCIAFFLYRRISGVED
jgi:hypothetical protein